MKVNCLFLCSVPISHIIPTQPLIEFLVSKNINVTVVTSKGNKERVESYGATFQEYPFLFVGNNDLNPLIERGIIFRELLNNNDYKKAFNFFIEKYTELFYDNSFENLGLLFNTIKKMKPDFIIRDAVDRYGSVIAKLLDIPCVGLITHCLYSKNFFEQQPSQLYKVFMDALHIEDLELNNYFNDFRKEVEKIHENVYMKSSTFKINTFHQFDPCEELTLINSIKTFQPLSSFTKDRKYMMIYPKKTRFEIEKKIDKNLIQFVELVMFNKGNIVYIATGSMLSLKANICIKLIDNLIHNGLYVIISNNTDYEELKEYYSLEKHKVYIDKFVPQQYVLANSKLFITSAGQNSILEAIYHKVPLLAIPITSEQKLNALMIEKSKIGKTTYTDRQNHRTFGALIKELLYNKEYQEHLSIMCSDLVHNKNNFDGLLEYVYEKQKKIKSCHIVG
jgi:MGT family glycosyltransferase